MNIKCVEPIEIRLNNVSLDPMNARVVYNLVNDSGMVIATNRIDMSITGYTRDMLVVILNELTKAVEHNDGINQQHELYEDVRSPKQMQEKTKEEIKEEKDKKMAIPQLTLPEGVKKTYENLQNKELKGSI